MSVNIQSAGSFAGLARRWLKTQLPFQGNAQLTYRDQQDSRAFEPGVSNQGGDQSGRSIFPSDWKRKLDDLETELLEREAYRLERRLRERLTPRQATVSLTFRGAIRGTISSEMPARVEWPGDEAVFTSIALEPNEPIDVCGRPFHGLRIALPARDARSGNPVNLTRAAQQHARHWDPRDAQVTFDQADQAFVWSEEIGAGYLWPAPGLDMVQFLLPVQNAGGERISIEASITFEEPDFSKRG